MKKLSIAAFVSAAVLSLSTIQAHAVTCSPADVTPGADACAGPLTNNVEFTGEVTFSNFDTEFGGDWANAYGGAAKGDSTLSAGGSNAFYSVGTGTNVSFTIFDVMADHDYGFTIKSSTSASLYVFLWDTIKNDAGYIATGDFAFTATTGGTSQNNQGKPQDISNSGLFKRDATTVVPLPAAGWLLLAGLGGLAAFRRKAS